MVTWFFLQDSLGYFGSLFSTLLRMICIHAPKTLSWIFFHTFLLSDDPQVFHPTQEIFDRRYSGARQTPSCAAVKESQAESRLVMQIYLKRRQTETREWRWTKLVEDIRSFGMCILDGAFSHIFIYMWYLGLLVGRKPQGPHPCAVYTCDKLSNLFHFVSFCFMCCSFICRIKDSNNSP